jgi:hypothetical protein
MGPELVGEDFLDYSMESENAVEPKPGRPSEIDAETLRRNVIELQFVLEQNWGAVGWLLKQAKTEADVRAAFERIVNPRCNLLEPFTKDHVCTRTALRPLRKRADVSVERRRRLHADVQRTQNACERVFNAWVAEFDLVKRARIHTMLAKCAQDYEEVASLDEKSRSEWETLRLELEECEAHFAQSEILTHLQGDRRRFTPLNVARAMAGLPFVTARVSIESCTKFGINPRNGVAFNMFRTIERLLREPINDLGQAIDVVRDHLVNGKDKNLPHATELRENWYFLESAIRLAAHDSSALYSSLPFRVFAEYAKTTTSHSAAEALLAEAHRL